LDVSKPNRSDAAVLKLEVLEDQGQIQLEDYAVVTRPEGAKKPWTREMRSPAKGGAVGGGILVSWWDSSSSSR
jgi:hypothetical protein